MKHIGWVVVEYHGTDDKEYFIDLFYKYRSGAIAKFCRYYKISKKNWAESVKLEDWNCVKITQEKYNELKAEGVK